MANRFIRYVLDGVKKEHDISFDITNADGVSVYVQRQKKDKQLDFSVIGSLDELRSSQGKIKLTQAYNSGDVLLILSSTVEQRVTNFAQAARFEESQIDAEFNNLLRLLEDAALLLQATPYFNPADIGIVNGQLPAIIPKGVLRVNDAGTEFELIELDNLPEFNAIIQAAEAARDAAKQSETNSASSESNAANSESASSAKAGESAASAELSKKWAVGDTPTGAPSDTRNAESFAKKAELAMKKAEDIVRTGAATDEDIDNESTAEKFVNLPQLWRALKPSTLVGKLWLLMSAKIFPVGAYIPWFGDVAPEGFAIAKNQAFDTVAYPELAKVFPNGIIPDMRGNGLMGAKDGETIGEFAEGQVKEHGHPNSTASSIDMGTKTTNTTGNHRHSFPSYASSGGVAGSGGFGSGNKYTSYAGNHAHTVEIGSHSHTLAIALFGATENTINHRKVNWIVRMA